MNAVTCPKCSARLNPPENSGGRTLRCGKCRAVIKIPEIETVEIESVDEPVLTPASPPPVPAHTVPQFRCPYCGCNYPPGTYKKISAGGWMMFVVLLFVCFLFSPLAMLITDHHRYCRGCGMRLD